MRYTQKIDLEIDVRKMLKWKCALRNFRNLNASFLVVYFSRNDKLDVMIGDTPPIDYIVGRKNYDCTLANINTFAQGSYGFGFPKTENSQKFKVRLFTSIFLKMNIFWTC